MPKNQMIKILEDPLRHESLAYGYNGVLAGLFARVLYELKIGPLRWYALMADFINDSRNATVSNQKDRTSMRGNLLKEFSKEQMTWKVFMKGLRFLQVQRFQITIHAWHANGSESVHHSKIINLGGRKLSEFLEDVDSPDVEDRDESESEESPAADAAALKQHAAATEAGQQDLFDSGEPLQVGDPNQQVQDAYAKLLPKTPTRNSP